MPETSAPTKGDPTASTVLDKSSESHLEALHRAAIGPIHADYFLPLLARFDTYGRAGPSWNGAASAATLNWLVFRGLWQAALVYAAGVAAGALGVVAIIRLAGPVPESVRWSLWAGLATLAVLVPGFFGNAWLYRAYRQRMDTALANTATLKDACMLLARQSSSRPRLVAITLANLVLAGVLASALWPSELRKRMWPRVDGEIERIATRAASAPRGSASIPSQATALPARAAEQPGAGVSAASPPANATAAVTPASSADAATAPAVAAATSAALVSALTAPALGPGARSASAQNAAIGAHARMARNRPAVASLVQPAQSQTPAGPSAPSASASGGFVINVGLFAEQENALRAHARLDAAGLPATSSPLQTRNGLRTRVRVGPFGTRVQADAAAEKIRALRLDAVVIWQ